MGEATKSKISVGQRVQHLYYDKIEGVVVAYSCISKQCLVRWEHTEGTAWYPEQALLPVVSLADSAASESSEGPAASACSDPVNQPQHYASGEIECIDAIRASMTREAFCGYLKGNVQKYMWRYEKKINPVEDIKKARWYSERLIKELEDA